MSRIPEGIKKSDSELVEFYQRESFSSHLNPTNTGEAKKAFFSGEHTPPFTYKPLRNADALLFELDDIRPNIIHPLASLIHEKIDATQLLIQALKDRSKESFDCLARFHQWYPIEEDIPLQKKDELESQSLDRSATYLIQKFKKALEERELDHWTIRTDTVMSARVQVNCPRREILVHPKALFRKRDIQRLIIHEIDVHAQRAENGQNQSLRCFSLGLPGSLLTEEGLAMFAEELNAVQSPGTLSRQIEVLKAIGLAKEMGFRELFTSLRKRCGTNLAWSISLRLKRGLSNPESGGVYAKDSVYLIGYQRVKKWLMAGGNVEHLYVGDVGIDHPVSLWLEEKWIELKKVPSFWHKALEEYTQLENRNQFANLRY